MYNYKYVWLVIQSPSLEVWAKGAEEYCHS